MFRSEAAVSKGMSGIHLCSPYSGNQSSFKHDLFQNENQNQNQQGGGSGLARYRSAPSSFLGSLLESNGDNNSSSGDEAEAFFSALMEGPRDLNLKSGYNNQMQYSMKREVEKEPSVHVQNGYESGDAVVGSYSVGMEASVVLHGNRNSTNSSSNLARQSSSPAGFLNGFSVMGDVGSYRVHAEASSAPGDLNNHMAYSLGPSSGARFMPSIPENGSESIGACSPETGRMRIGNKAVFPQNSWNESQFKGLKRNREDDANIFPNFNDFESQNRETRKGLVQHLSLPTNTGKVAVTEKILHFQQETAVPCQMRAKRGCATHPRSIAERNRRTRISEKMKKLQDLFPTMDKQTNTADMLDLAVDYIRDLQRQVQTLMDKKAKCVCSIKSQ